MKNLLKPLTQVNFFVTLISLVVYAAIRFEVVFLRATPKGDESGFLSAFKMFIDQGFYEANVAGNSVVFNIVSYVFYKMSLNELQSLRLTSLFFGLLSLLLLWFFYKKYFNIPKNYRVTAFLTAINTMVIMSWIFTGINDIILAFFTIVFFGIIFKIKNSKSEDNYLFVVIGLVLALLLATRMMSILFYPSVFVVLVSVLYLKRASAIIIFKKLILSFTSFLIFILLLNMPSLIEKGTLSFHKKEIKTEGVNWTQLQYLTAIGVEKGSLPYGKHYSVQEVKQYLIENGEGSLPKTLTESLFFDFRMTVKEFFVDLLYEIKPFTRLLGLFFIFNLLLFIWYLIKKKWTVRNVLNQHIIIFSLIYLFLVCFIVITYVETRWFSNILLLLPIVFAERLFKFKKAYKLGNNFDFSIINLQLLSLLIMSLPYSIENFKILL